MSLGNGGATPASPHQIRASDARRFLLKLTVAATPFLIVPLLNYEMDPGHLFHRQEAVSEVMGYLRAGYNVVGHGSIDDRLFQQQFIASLPARPALSVLGSSRVQLLSSGTLGVPLANNGVGAASLNDLFAVYQYYRKRGLLPARMLIGIDPWMLNEHHQDLPLRRNSPDVDALRHDLRLPSATLFGLPGAVRFMKLRELFSPAYFRESARDLLDGAPRLDSFSPTRQVVNSDGTRLTDGAVTYGEADRIRSAEQVARDAEAENTNPFYGFEDFTEVTPAQRRAMLAFFQSLRKDGVDVRVMLMPFHPVVVARLERARSYVTLSAAEAAIRSIAASAGVPVSGSYLPARLGWDQSAFLDGKHLREANAVAIARAALAK